MGVADNRSYKNEYHFTDVTKPTSEQHPSIESDPKINTTIKKNPYRSNVEIEGGEMVLQPDLSAIFKATGKKHSKGGMDVLLKPDSFVFSDYKGLKISEDEAEDFELKEGGTPAGTLKKNVDIKHYNTLVQNVTNPYKDDLSKKSSARMLEKYIKTLGNIAYIQESKKGFPQGLPDFSVGTAPIEDDSIEKQIDENKQYMKAGGTTNNPYFQKGGNPTYDEWLKMSKRLYATNKTPYQQAVTDRFLSNPNISYLSTPPQQMSTQPPQINTQPQSISTQLPNNQKYPDKWINYYDKKSNTQYTAPDWITPSEFYSTPGLIDYMKTLDKQSGIDWDMGKADDSHWGWRHKAALDKFFPNRKPNVTEKQYNLPGLGMRTSPDTELPISKLPEPNIPNTDYTPQGVKRADWKFTPWQKLSQAYNWAQFADAKRYMPYRSRYTPSYVEPALVNPEQAVGDMRSMTNQQLSALSTLSPILRNAQSAGNFGQLLNQIPGVRSQYDNQNAQILNQTRQFNSQVKNNANMINMGNDQQYYTQAVEGRKNFDNMRTYLSNAAMNNVLRDVEGNQKLAYNLLTQNNPAYGYDWNTGNFTRTNKSIMDVASNNQQDFFQDFMKELDSARTPEEIQKAQIKSKLMMSKLFLPYLQQFSPIQKKGGKTKNPYK